MIERGLTGSQRDVAMELAKIMMITLGRDADHVLKIIYDIERKSFANLLFMVDAVWKWRAGKGESMHHISKEIDALIFHYALDYEKKGDKTMSDLSTDDDCFTFSDAIRLHSYLSL